jgi:hypothetical protein
MPKSDLSLDLTGYAPVADRLALFYQKHPSGRIVTELVSHEGGRIIFKACIYRDGAQASPAATGWAAEREGDGDINTVACLENAETSAIGRALANLGFAASSRRPSREEMAKAERARGRVLPYPAASTPARGVRERGGVRLQQDANAAHDLIELLARCEEYSFPPRRAEVIRRRVNAVPALPPARVERIEARLRHWLRRADYEWLM